MLLLNTMIYPVLLVLGALFLLPRQPLPKSTVSHPSLSGCRTADTVTVPQRLAFFRDLVTTTDTADIAVRDSLHLSATQASKVSLVTKASTCVSAANAVNSYRQESGVSRQVWVYKIGNDYGVEDPGITSQPGEYRPIYIFTGQFVYKSTLAM